MVTLSLFLVVGTYVLMMYLFSKAWEMDINDTKFRYFYNAIAIILFLGLLFDLQIVTNDMNQLSDFKGFYLYTVMFATCYLIIYIGCNKFYTRFEMDDEHFKLKRKTME